MQNWINKKKAKARYSRWDFFEMDGIMFATTTTEQGHSHIYALNQDGNGVTSESDHIHEVKNWVVMTAEGHTHRLKTNHEPGNKIVEDPILQEHVNPESVTEDKLEIIKKNNF
jgi:hypothetical protein